MRRRAGVAETHAPTSSAMIRLLRRCSFTSMGTRSPSLIMNACMGRWCVRPMACQRSLLWHWKKQQRKNKHNTITQAKSALHIEHDPAVANVFAQSWWSRLSTHHNWLCVRRYGHECIGACAGMASAPVPSLLQQSSWCSWTLGLHPPPTSWLAPPLAGTLQWPWSPTAPA
jgi:hypothetical protein